MDSPKGAVTGSLSPLREVHRIAMSSAQASLYRSLYAHIRRRLGDSTCLEGNAGDFDSVDRAVCRLLQASSNPLLAVTQLPPEIFSVDPEVVETLASEGIAAKMKAVADHARVLAGTGSKCVIWTIFDDSIAELERILADLNPVSVSRTSSESTSDEARDYDRRLKRFSTDPNCTVAIGNAATLDGPVELGDVCLHAIYLDRSYSLEQFVWSLSSVPWYATSKSGKPWLHIYQNEDVVGVRNIDTSVDRRLEIKRQGQHASVDSMLCGHGSDLRPYRFESEHAWINSGDLADLLDYTGR